MNRAGTNVSRERRQGFTLTEIMVSLAIFGLVVASTLPVYFMCNRNWHSTSLSMQAAAESSMALEKIVYGMGLQYGMRSAIATSVVVSVTGSDWVVKYVNSEGGTNRFAYDASATVLTYLGSTSTVWALVGSNITACVLSNSAGGMSITVTTGLTDGRFAKTNTMSTYLSYRN